MKLPMFSFKIDYHKQLIGKTIWERIKNSFADKYEIEKYVGGTYYNMQFFKWYIRDINVYLPSIARQIKVLNLLFNGVKKKWKDLDDTEKELTYEVALTNVIAHEYLHHIFYRDFDLTPKQQHWAIGKLGIWTNKD